MKKLIGVLLTLVYASGAIAQVPPIRGEYSAGVYKNIQVDVNGNLITASTTTDTGLELAQGSTTSGQVGPLVQAATTTSAPTYTTAKTNPLSLNTSGGLRVDGSGVTQPVSGTVTASTPTGTLTDRSGTITLGGTAQTIMAANSSRKYLMIQNTSDTAMWCNFTTTAVATQPSFQIVAGASFFMESGFISTEAVSCIGATTSKIFTAKEG